MQQNNLSGELPRGKILKSRPIKNFGMYCFRAKILPEKEPLVFRDASFFRVFPRFVPVTSLQTPCLTGSDFGSQSFTNTVCWRIRNSSDLPLTKQWTGR